MPNNNKVPGTAAATKKVKSKAAGGRIKQTGRTRGSVNNGNTYQRNLETKFRVTEGYKETIRLLKAQDPTGKTSEGDIMLEALQLYAMRKAVTKQDVDWIKQII